MKFWGRFFTFILSIVFLFSCTIVVFGNSSSERDSFALDVMTKYINATYKGSSSVIISEPVPIFDFDTNSIGGYYYFAISDDTIVGVLSVYYSNGEYVSSYVYEPHPYLVGAYEENKLISLVSYFEDIILITETDKMFLTNNLNNIDLSSVSLDNLPIELLQIRSTDIIVPIRPQSRTLNLIKIYDVPYVSNYTLSNGKGLCWAACIAALSNFYKNTSYTALDIYNLCDTYYSETPVGTETWYSRAYPLLGLAVSINTTSPALTYNQIYGYLETYGPFHIDMQRTDETGALKGHAIILCGIQVFQDTEYDSSNYYSIYHFRDPNKESVITVVADYETMLNGALLSYYNTLERYDTWIRTVIVTNY